MPLLAVAAGKAMPDMAIGYITRKDKAKYIDVQNLFIDEDWRGSGNIRTTTRESIIILSCPPTEKTKPMRLGYKSTPKPMRKKPSLIVSA